MGTHYQGTEQERRALDTYIKLMRASDSTLARTTAHFADNDLSVSQFAVLEALYHLGPMNQRDLGEKLLKSPGNITSVLKGMERRALIVRRRSEADNRVKQVMLTEIGRSLIESVFPRHVQIVLADMSVLTTEEQAELARLCRKLGLQGQPE
jgi:MarR family 2-MHQ and catechol resistance regulon transcriptional repressor